MINHRPSEGSTTFNSYKASRQVLLSIFCQFSSFSSRLPLFSMRVNEIPPWWYGMWCESSDRGTLILAIHPGGLCPASSLSVQTQKFPTKTTWITAQVFTPSLSSHSISHLSSSRPIYLFSSLSHHIIFKTQKHLLWRHKTQKYHNIAAFSWHWEWRLRILVSHTHSYNIHL